MCGCPGWLHVACDPVLVVAICGVLGHVVVGGYGEGRLPVWVGGLSTSVAWCCVGYSVAVILLRRFLRGTMRRAGIFGIRGMVLLWWRFRVAVRVLRV